MARMVIDGFDDLDKLFNDLSNADMIAIDAVNEAVPILEESMKSAINSVTNKGYSTGELAASISHKPARKNEYGVFAAVLPFGVDSKRVSNAKKAAVLEYGRRGGYPSRGTGQIVTEQEPAPFRAKAVNAAKNKCEETMRKVVEERMGCE